MCSNQNNKPALLISFWLLSLKHVVCFLLDDQFNSSSERSSFINEPVGRLSFISADGSEIDSDYSSASSVFHTGSEEQRNLE